MRQERLELLRDALTALASDAPDQVRYLNSLEMPASVDELALDLEAIAAAAPEMLDNGEIDAEQFECVRSLNERLSEMSGPHNAGLWTEAALLSSPQWDAIRDRAKACLGLLSPSRSEN